jgi:hypothetical protein
MLSDHIDDPYITLLAGSVLSYFAGVCGEMGKIFLDIANLIDS